MTFLMLVVVCLLVLLSVRIILQIVTRLTLGRCTCNTYLAGKTALITGGNSGLGYETALALAGRGCRVIIADRDNCDETKDNIIKITGNTNIITKHFDLASLKSVRSLAKDINETEKRLDILINNAGTTGLGNRYTEDGLHVGMQVNHFGSFLLTHLLIGILKKTAPSRIIFVSSLFAHYNNLTPKNLNYHKDAPVNMWSEFRIYCNSKLCNLITASELSKKLSGTGVTAYSLHPGLVSTAIFSKLRNGLSHTSIYYWLFEKLILQPFAKSAEEGAQTTIHLALAKEVEKFSGKYFSDCKVFIAPSKSADPLFVENIWKLSEEFVKLTPEELL